MSRADGRGPNPGGRCLCGCGKPAPLSPVTRRSNGDVRGAPRRYIAGHHNRTAKARARTAQRNRSPAARAASSKVNRTHGLSSAPVYGSWTSMLDRCRDPRNNGYRHYGARGVCVCVHLAASPAHLRALLGRRPPGHELDRLDPDGHYSCGSCADCRKHGWPRNVRWLDARENRARARRPGTAPARVPAP